MRTSISIIWSRRGVVAVQTGKVQVQDLSSIVTASGEIKPPDQDFASVNANSFGKITEILVKEGQQVTRGQKIAEMGNTDADQVKLHFEIRRLGKPMDPAKYLPPA